MEETAAASSGSARARTASGAVPGSATTSTRRPKFAFVIDQRKCIGCHACTVACKSENEVPLAKFRTWVKYVEKGTFPSVKRHFTVLRCNHCDAAPCVEICPVIALHKRPDAIVDLDRDRCIGCRACMQACPYDALYLNEENGVAEKCHYCAHRTELGLEPACVVVCPEKAIISGDASDPETPISKLIRDEETSQRRLDKGTKPRLWYIDALPEAIVPAAQTEKPMYLWSERPTPQPQIPPGFEPPADIVATLDVGHAPQWGWHIWTYLLTKNVSAGAVLVAPFLAALGVGAGIARDVVPEIAGLFFLTVTMVLLIHDLGRPERFWRLLLTPNTKSWLVKGGWVLTAFGLVTAGSLGARLLGEDAAADTLRWVNVPLAILASGYSAFLFAQCRARDLWHAKVLFLSLVAEAAACGVGLAMLLSAGRGAGPPFLGFFFALVAVRVLAMAEGRSLPSTDHAKRAHAIQELTARREAHFLLLAVAMLAVTLPLFFEFGALPATACAAFAVALAFTSFFLRGRAWIRAGQAVPIS